MTRDDTIRMAREAGFAMENSAAIQAAERFFALVTTTKLNNMISDGWRQCARGQKTTQFCGLAEEARKNEWKKCLEIADDCAASDMHASVSAVLIRARGNT